MAATTWEELERELRSLPANASVKRRVIVMLEGQQSCPDGTLTNEMIAQGIERPVASVRRATRELLRDGYIDCLGIADGCLEYQIASLDTQRGWLEADGTPLLRVWTGR
jgi:hypothetical protein